MSVAEGDPEQDYLLYRPPTPVQLGEGGALAEKGEFRKGSYRKGSFQTVLGGPINLQTQMTGTSPNSPFVQTAFLFILR